jgi:hypothetical protein
MRRKALGSGLVSSILTTSGKEPRSLPEKKAKDILNIKETIVLFPSLINREEE